MNIGSISSGNTYVVPMHQSPAMKIKDNDGDYDNGTGADDVTKTKLAQNGAGIDIQA